MLVDAIVRLWKFRRPAVWSRARRCCDAPSQTGSIWNNGEERDSGSRVPKVEVTGQYKLASSSARWVHGSLARCATVVMAGSLPELLQHR